MGSLEVSARDMIIADGQSDDHAQMLCNYGLVMTSVKVLCPETTNSLTSVSLKARSLAKPCLGFRGSEPASIIFAMWKYCHPMTCAGFSIQISGKGLLPSGSQSISIMGANVSGLDIVQLSVSCWNA